MSSHVLLIIAVALVVASVCKYWDVNAAIPLIAAGFALDWVVPRTSDQLLDPELILSLVLTPLVFAAGLASSAVDLRRVKRSLLLLAFVLVVLSTTVIGAVCWMIIPAVPIAAALALGAALAPTDAVAASIVAKKSGLPNDV
ncbi:MAG: cation:proton antiporter, partial [Actinomycetes bacterium]